MSHALQALLLSLSYGCKVHVKHNVFYVPTLSSMLYLREAQIIGPRSPDGSSLPLRGYPGNFVLGGLPQGFTRGSTEIRRRQKRMTKEKKEEEAKKEKPPRERKKKFLC